MKKEYTTHKFKVKHAAGVHYRGTFFKRVGKSRIDGYPIYECKTEIGVATDWRFYFQDFVFNQRPGYTPGYDDFEYIHNSEDWLPLRSDLIVESGLTMAPPSGVFYYIDYIYDEFDERLNLML